MRWRRECGWDTCRAPTNGMRNAAGRGFRRTLSQTAADGSVTLTGTVKVAGLGGADHRDGSYAYYTSTPVVSNDPKGVGAFLLAASEMEMSGATSGLGETVLLDAWYNSQTRTNAAGQTELFHYKWNDFANSGFSLFGHIWRSYGVATRTLTTAPTAEKLRGAQFYIIASPDNPSKNSQSALHDGGGCGPDRAMGARAAACC